MTNTSEQLFPRELLAHPDQERHKYFAGIRIDHQLMNQAKAELEDAIRSAEPDSLIFGYGPVGVGKSTLADLVTRQIVEARWERLRQDLERNSAVRVAMPAPVSGTFSWEEGFRSMFEALATSLIPPLKSNEGEQVSDLPRSSARLYQHAYEKGMSHRRPIVVILDDAHYLGTVPIRRLANQLDVMKCLAAKTGTPHALLGGYDLLRLRNLSGQLSRRSIDIHFRRYRDNDMDLECFTRAVCTLQSHLPVRRSPDLSPYIDYLMEGSVGCIGNLKRWLGAALRQALSEAGETLTIDHMRKRAWPNAQISNMLSEAVNGEERLEAEKSSLLRRVGDANTDRDEMRGMRRSTRNGLVTDAGHSRARNGVGKRHLKLGADASLALPLRPSGETNVDRS